MQLQAESAQRDSLMVLGDRGARLHSFSTGHRESPGEPFVSLKSSEHIQNETQGNRYSWCTDGNCLAGILLFLLGKHRSEWTATSSAFEQFQYFFAEGCLQRICELSPTGRDAFSYLNYMFAGGLCNPKTTR